MLRARIRPLGLLLGGFFLIGVLAAPPRARAQGTLGQQYLGCWRDDAAHVLTGAATGTRTDMTNGLCIAICRQPGFPFAGTQGGQCFCGPDYRRRGPAEEGSCNAPCPGHPSEPCGGPGVLSVYTTTHFALPPAQPANRPPAVPTPFFPPSTWAAALPAAGVTLHWQHNGDPDRNPVSFLLQLYQYAPASQQWGLVLQHWVTVGTSLRVPSLQPGGYYSWLVSAFDGTLWSQPSAPAFFATLL
jgi:WSC domain